MFLSVCGCSWLSMRGLYPNTAGEGGFSWDGLGSWLWGMFGDSHFWVVGSSGCGWCILVLTGGSTWARSWMEVITGAEKKLEHGCGKYSELKKRGEPEVEALRNKVCKALFQLEKQILSVCLSSTRCRLTELHQLCQGGCESTVPGIRDVTLLSQPPDLRGGSCPVVTAAALHPLPIPVLAPQFCCLSHRLGCACEFDH